MPIYYFDVFDGQKVVRDEFGVELPNVDEAADEAAALLPDFARETIPDRQSHSFAAAVRDEAGSVVYQAMLLFQGQRVIDHDTRYAAIMADTQCQTARMANLKAEAKMLGGRLVQNIEGLLTTFEDMRANLEASRRARRDRVAGRA